MRKQLLAFIFASKHLHIMEARRDVFQAIADPTRRQIIGLLVQQPLNVNSIADKFNVTRQAVSLHVKILTECGLIMIRQQGRERYCEARLEGLGEVAGWIEQYRQFFENKLDALELYLDDLQKNKKYAKRNKQHRR